MTTLTGRTEQSLPGVVAPPRFEVALGGAAAQLAALGYVWANYSPAGPCLRAPLACLRDPLAAHPFGFNVFLLAMMMGGVWRLSIQPLVSARADHSDPSYVDKLWSVTPWAWCWLLYARAAPEGRASGRLLLMCLCATAWGTRLTWNFYIKGGYSGGEDYRWAEVRRWFPGWRYELFNAVFICGFQQALLLAISAPAAAAMESSAPLGALDATAAALWTALLAMQAVADAQQFCFQSEKYRRRAERIPPGPEYEAGFLSRGLWAYSRHPNYFCEVALWWVFYLFSVPATGAWLNWTGLGAAGLTLLFVPPGASVDVTEALSSRKYPAYPDYQARVSRFVPWFPRRAKPKSA